MRHSGGARRYITVPLFQVDTGPSRSEVCGEWIVLRDALGCDCHTPPPTTFLLGTDVQLEPPAARRIRSRSCSAAIASKPCHSGPTAEVIEQQKAEDQK